MKQIFFLMVIIAISLTACKAPDNGSIKMKETEITKAVAVLQPLNGSSVHGVVYFNYLNGTTEVIADVKGLPPGDHGFHIHTYGDLREEDGSSTDGHYNPTSMKHGGPATEERHIGDLGNIHALEDSTAQFKQDRYTFTINGENPILGRSIVIHAGEDDYTSQPSGNSGTKIAVGVIGIANTDL